jgi:predicted DNA-binding transcriptional regulator YafY
MASNRTTVSFKTPEQAERLNQVLEPTTINGPSQLLQAIADQTIAPIAWSPEIQSALLAAVVALQGQRDPRASTLLDAFSKLPLSPPNQAEIERLRQRYAGWVAEAKKNIAQQQPFQLRYHGKDRTVLYAEIAHHDGREYLHCWIAEPNKKAELPELAHNRLFFTGEEAIVSKGPSGATWRTEGLDSVEVVFRVAFRYRTKPEDQVVAVEAVQIGEEAWTLVTQRVTNLLWFMQRVARYGDRCVIEGPETIREIRLQQIRAELAAYESEG